MKKERLSSIELLRIIAILFVLINHVTMVTCSLPTAEFMTGNPANAVARVLFSVLSVGGVDIFIIISGWFGIHASRRGLGKYIYEVCFLLWLILIGFAIADRGSITVEAIKASVCLYNGYWFIMAYLGLYILSPVLNAFVESATRKQFAAVLIAFYLFQCYFSWLASVVDYYSGYSVTLFCTLYLTARYARLYPVKIVDRHAVAVYIGIMLAMTLIVAVGIRFTGTALRMLRYDNPLVIVSSLCLVSAFSKWNCHNRIVNRIALSCFAVYIIHFNPLVFPYFTKGVMYLWTSMSGIVAAACILAYLIAVFLACSAVDQLRIATWGLLAKRMKSHGTTTRPS